MCLRFHSLVAAASVWALSAMLALAGDTRALRVCADPNNLPFSNERQEGFENRLAALLAQDLHAHLEYTWLSERKSYIKNSLDAGQCDVLLGVPVETTSAETTKPYYRSTYMFVSRQDRHLKLPSLYDEALDRLRIGVHVVDDSYAPPAHLLASRGLAANLAGYSLFGKYGETNPPAKLVQAVENRDVDVAIVWGPFAGYFGAQQSAPLEITPVAPARFMSIPFTFAMSLAVRKGNQPLRNELNQLLARECLAIQEILAEYHIPLIQSDEEKQCGSQQVPPSAPSH